jgi:hypothetical protein
LQGISDALARCFLQEFRRPRRRPAMSRDDGARFCDKSCALAFVPQELGHGNGKILFGLDLNRSPRFN